MSYFIVIFIFLSSGKLFLYNNNFASKISYLERITLTMKFFRVLVFFLLIFSISSYAIADDVTETVDESLPVSSETSSNEPEIYSRHVLVYERNSNCVLYEKNAYEQCKMASTTKIMTCILILENCDLSATVTVSSKSANTTGSRLGLHTNDTITVMDLLYGLMLCSGNDAAVALAEFCSGSVEEFASLMNSKAQQLSLTSTHFATPHGLDNDDHYTTAYDFAVLTDYALENPQFVEIVGTKYYTVTLNGSAKSIHNTNPLLGSLSSVYGVKTGYTSQAGRCLISAAEQNNLDIIVVVLGADTSTIRTKDSVNLINYIFANYEAIDISALINDKYRDFADYILPYIYVNKASAPLSSKLQDISIQYYPVKKDEIDSISVSLSEEILEAPVFENQKIGNIVISISNDEIYSTNILSDAYISKKSSLDYLYFFITNFKSFYQAY